MDMIRANSGPVHGVHWTTGDHWSPLHPCNGIFVGAIASPIQGRWHGKAVTEGFHRPF